MAKIFRSSIGRQRFSMQVFGWPQEVMRPSHRPIRGAQSLRRRHAPHALVNVWE
jgi:hypothetical protein